MKVTASACGKVLIVGGYLVLQDKVPGLVVSTSSKFHTSVETKEFNSSSANTISVKVVSPQLHDSWEYFIDLDLPFKLQPVTTKTNTYVQYAIDVALLACCGHYGFDIYLNQLQNHAGRVLEIVLLADNDFYSQKHHLVTSGLPVTSDSLRSLPNGIPCPINAETGKVMLSKTGLGSSAALVSSVSAAVLAFMNVLQQHANGDVAVESKQLVHDVAQIAHGLAQGKVGSGFDVCSAVMGSIRYCRIPQATLGAYMDRVEKTIRTGKPTETEYFALGREICSLSKSQGGNENWTYSATPFGLARGLALMLADVEGGSETPGMVKKVLEWNSSGADKDPEVLKKVLQTATTDEQLQNMTRAAETAHGLQTWKAIAAANARIETLMETLRGLESTLEESTYDSHILELSKHPVKEWVTFSNNPLHNCMIELAEAFLLSRSLLATMGELAKVPIEPPAQTTLANSTCEIPGVLAAGVPGAGGYDALFAIVLELESRQTNVRENVENLWVNWPGGGLTPLLLRNGPPSSSPGAGLSITKAY